MADVFDNLYCVGPGAIGPGTNVTRSILDPDRNRGTITKMYRNDSGITPAQLAGLYTLSAGSFPGTSILLDSTFIRQISDKLALVVSRYGSSGGTNFKTVMTRSPSGYRQLPYWDAKADYTSKVNNYVGDPKNGQLRPKYWLTLPQVVVRWSSTVFSDTRPSDNAGLIGKVNSNAYSIDGYSHAKETLKFGGSSIRHDKYGGYDRWTISHSATYDPRGKHRSPDDLILGDFDAATGTYAFTLSNGGDGEQRNPEATFPNLP